MTRLSAIISLFFLLTPAMLSAQNRTTVRFAEITGHEAQDYSGIACIGQDSYIVVTDKKDGFYVFNFDVDDNGVPGNIARSWFYGDSTATRDCEDIAFVPYRDATFICGEKDQRILEYDLNKGSKTGYELAVPKIFKQTADNYGFEALDYDPVIDRFWTTTESTLPIDGLPASPSNPTHNLLRIQSFNSWGKTFQPVNQYAYKTEKPEATGTPTIYAFGVPALLYLPDGRMLVLEREFSVDITNFQNGVWVRSKLFMVDVTDAKDVTDVTDLRMLGNDDFLAKTLLWDYKSDFNNPAAPIANLEGMCLGPQLSDGRQTIIFVNDAQGGMFGILKEYITVLALDIPAGIKSTVNFNDFK